MLDKDARIARFKAARERLSLAMLAPESNFCASTPYPCYLKVCEATPLVPVCSLQDAHRLSKRLHRVGIPRRYWDATFEKALDFFKTDPRSHYKSALEYVEDYQTNIRTGKNVILRGDVGKGKTYLAMCIANALVDREVDIYVASSTRIANKLHAAREMYNGSLEEYRRKLFTVPVLFFDDWLAGYLDDWVKSELVSIVRERTNLYKPIIATTNLTREGVIKAVDTQPDLKPAIDRLFDNAESWSLTIKTDLRQAGARLNPPTS